MLLLAKIKFLNIHGQKKIAILEERYDFLYSLR